MTKSEIISPKIYGDLALSQIPRILTLQDRNPFSKTYGSFARTYWLDRTADFPTALAQYAVHALALVWAHDLPGNIYFRHPKVLDWVFAGMENFVACQHKDGSFDEFYPNERGWAGPTGFLVYAMGASYLLVKDQIAPILEKKLLDAIFRAGKFLGRYEEIGTLANHYVMGALGIAYAKHVTGDDSLMPGFDSVLNKTLALFNDEGWGLEYDGADIGYLSASVSFFAKILQVHKDERIDKAMARAVEFSSYFVYPDGHFAGTLGSRNTLHFYPHGYELLAPENPLAARIADAMIAGLGTGALVPPHIMADRYFLYRVPEFLLSCIESKDRPASGAALPYEQDDFNAYFPGGRYFISKQGDGYLVVNAGKGGVTKAFSIEKKRLVYADSGVMIEINGRTASTQWVDKKYKVERTKRGVEISGNFHRVPGALFTPFKMILFRLFLITVAGNAKIAYKLKGWIRKALMLVHKDDPSTFVRNISFDGAALAVTDEIRTDPGAKITRACFGDDIPVRYVPQSRYFQPQELNAEGWWGGAEQLDALCHGFLRYTRKVNFETGHVIVKAQGHEGRDLE